MKNSTCDHKIVIELTSFYYSAGIVKYKYIDPNGASKYTLLYYDITKKWIQYSTIVIKFTWLYRNGATVRIDYLIRDITMCECSSIYTNDTLLLC